MSICLVVTGQAMYPAILQHIRNGQSTEIILFNGGCDHIYLTYYESKKNVRDAVQATLTNERLPNIQGARLNQ